MAVSGGSGSAPELKYRVGFVVGCFLTAGSAFLDAIGFFLGITGIGEIVTQTIGYLGSIGFFGIFIFLRANFFNKKSIQKIGVGAVGSIVEMIPFLNAISPTFTIETVSLIYLMRKEDGEKSEKDTARTLEQQKSANTALTYRVQRRQVEQAANDNEQELRQVA